MLTLAPSKSRKILLVASSIGIVLLVVAACNGTSSSRSKPGAGSAPGAEINPAGDIPDNQAYVPFRARSGAYELKVPEGWSRTNAAGRTRFTSKLNSIHLQESAAPAKPTAAYVRGTEVPRLKASTTDFALFDVTMIGRPAGDAILLKYEQKSAKDQVTGRSVRDAVEQYEFWKNGRQVTITLTSPKGADNVDPWRTVTDSFRWLR